MDCEEAKRLLGWYHDGELNAADRDRVAAHVERCPACAAEFAALARLDRASRRLASPDPPPEVWDRIALKLGARGAGKRGLYQVLHRRRFFQAAGIVAAAVAGSFLASGLLRRRVPQAISDFPVPESEPLDVDFVSTNLAGLTADDRRLVESQEMCGCAVCTTRLGAAGAPIKVVLEKQSVFVCSQGCEEWVRAHPTQALAKLQVLEQQHHAHK
jgi:hypothetical protein